MKALSIKQPWLYCITDLDKRVENRTWKPPDWIVGQRMALHASARPDNFSGNITAARLAGRQVSGILHNIPLGAIVATATVVGWFNSNGAASDSLLIKHIDDKWFFGPFGWVLDDVRKIKKPVHCRGRLGLWDVPTAVSSELAP